jgi:hypothetical protein
MTRVLFRSLTAGLIAGALAGLLATPAVAAVANYVVVYSLTGVFNGSEHGLTDSLSDQGGPNLLTTNDPFSFTEVTSNIFGTSTRLTVGGKTYSVGRDVSVEVPGALYDGEVGGVLPDGNVGAGVSGDGVSITGEWTNATLYGYGGFFTVALTPADYFSAEFRSLPSAQIPLDGGQFFLTVGNYDLNNPSNGIPNNPNGNAFSASRVIPESSTWAMMLIGFAGLGYAGYRKARRTVVANA